MFGHYGMELHGPGDYSKAGWGSFLVECPGSLSNLCMEFASFTLQAASSRRLSCVPSSLVCIDLSSSSWSVFYRVGGVRKGRETIRTTRRRRRRRRRRRCNKSLAKKTMGLKEDFDQAAKDALTLPASTTNDDKLVLYGLFKTATVGKPETSRPGIFDQKGRAKWDAWKKVEDKSKDEAMQDYILKVTQLKEA